ncbi:hypothetical protein M378DRAFT_160993 [Amanita muscaria Koide BX008]|uniref:Uncharacterized protein n=1 Tax=Amanita muscaria (strain Koide BX008) TaxID=946122 RepID=A0A0C2THW3_AMAMK|nr:hypothetical protein M378DRAFT_160993 [Amanita muscaria Koide BX008]
MNSHQLTPLFGPSPGIMSAVLYPRPARSKLPVWQGDTKGRVHQSNVSSAGNKLHDGVRTLE